MIYDFHIFPTDKYMFSIGICRLILMIEILKLVEKCKIDKGSQRSLRAEHLTTKLASVAGICQILEIYCGVAWEDGNT